MRVIDTLENRIKRYFLDLDTWNYLIKIDEAKLKGVKYETFKTISERFECPLTSVYLPIKKLAKDGFIILGKSQIVYTRIIEKKRNKKAMTAIYDQPTNTLNEVVSMEPPSRKPYLQMTDEDWKEFDRQAQEYNDHVGSLRTIPCDPSCRDKFVHGGEYTYEKHYRLKSDRKGGHIAILVPQLLEEDELWKEAIMILFDLNVPPTSSIIEGKIKELKKHFTITKNP